MTTFLVDTYDTGRGVRNAIEVTRGLRLPGPVGVRLDSGDLAALARMARAMLDEAGLDDARIFASGSLDEYAIAGLVAAGAPIDAWGWAPRWESPRTRRTWTAPTSWSPTTDGR